MWFDRIIIIEWQSQWESHTFVSEWMDFFQFFFKWIFLCCWIAIYTADCNRDQPIHTHTQHTPSNLIVSICSSFCMMIINFILLFRRICIPIGVCLHCSWQPSLLSSNIYTHHDRVNTLAHTHKYACLFICRKTKCAHCLFFSMFVFYVIGQKNERKKNSWKRQRWNTQFQQWTAAIIWCG